MYQTLQLNPLDRKAEIWVSLCDSGLLSVSPIQTSALLERIMEGKSAHQIVFPEPGTVEVTFLCSGDTHVFVNGVKVGPLRKPNRRHRIIMALAAHDILAFDLKPLEVAVKRC